MDETSCGSYLSAEDVRYMPEQEVIIISKIRTKYST